MFKPVVVNVLDVISVYLVIRIPLHMPATTTIALRPPASCVTSQPTDAYWNKVSH